MGLTTSAKHCCITPECREARGDAGALEEAFARIKREYEACVEGWKDSKKQPTFHLQLFLERPG